MEKIKIEDLVLLEEKLLSDNEILEIEGSIRELSAEEMKISGGGYGKGYGDDDDDKDYGKGRGKGHGKGYGDDDDICGGKYGYCCY
jgi:hypothetical protein